MAEFGSRERQESEEEQIFNLLSEARSQVELPPGNDRVIAAFNNVLIEYAHVPEIEKVIKLAVHVDDPAYAINKMQRCFYKQFLFRERPYDYTFPQDFMVRKHGSQEFDMEESTRRMKDSIVAIMHDEARATEIHEDFMTRNTQSNIVQRYSMLKLLANLTKSRFDDAPSVIDYGCSQNIGLKKLASGTPFESIRVFTQKPGERKRFSMPQTSALSALLDDQLQLGHSTGIDIFNANDPANIEWAQACSFYPSELMANPHRMAEFTILEDIEFSNVDFLQADITDYSERDLQRNVNNGKTMPRDASIAFASTALYMINNEHDRNAIYEAMERDTAVNGLVAVLDFVRQDKHGHLRFSGPGGRKHKYALYVKDKLQPETGWQEAARIYDGRVRELRFCAARLAINGKLSTIPEILARQK